MGCADHPRKGPSRGCPKCQEACEAEENELKKKAEAKEAEDAARIGVAKAEGFCSKCRYKGCAECRPNPNPNKKRPNKKRPNKKRRVAQAQEATQEPIQEQQEHPESQHQAHLQEQAPAQEVPATNLHEKLLKFMEILTPVLVANLEILETLAQVVHEDH